MSTPYFSESGMVCINATGPLIGQVTFPERVLRSFIRQPNQRLNINVGIFETVGNSNMDVEMKTCNHSRLSSLVSIREWRSVHEDQTIPSTTRLYPTIYFAEYSGGIITIQNPQHSLHSSPQFILVRTGCKHDSVHSDNNILSLHFIP